MKSIIILLLLSATAAAEPWDPTFDPLSMNRHTPISAVSIELGFESWDEPANTDIDVYTVNVAGHFVNKRGFGGYFVVPMTYLNLRLGGFDDSDLAIGNVELGGIFTKFFGATALSVHVGVGLPTAQDDGASAFQAFGSFTRLTDFALHVTNSTWLRTGISPMGRVGAFLWRADLGVDIALDEDNAVQYSPVVYANIGGGVDLGSAQLLAEIVNVIADPDDGSDEDATSVTLGARFTSGNLRPGVGILLPIDIDAADNFDFAILGSLAIRVPGL